MGADIHAVAQKKTPSGFEDVPTEWDRRRHYFLFAWLAGVRNGYGFAGVVTHAPITPVSEPRGLPDDFLIIEDHSHPCRKEIAPGFYAQEHWDDSVGLWLGDHSHSWLSFDEIISAAPPITWRTGMIDRVTFDGWDGISPPEEWCSDVFGQGVRVADNPACVTDEDTYVRVCWRTTAANEIDYFLTEIRRLKELHGDGRIVFGFDN